MNFERIAGKLQQRIAEQAARYEGDLAVQADQYETQIEQLQKRITEFENQKDKEED